MRSFVTRSYYAHITSAGAQDSGNIALGVIKTGTGVYSITIPANMRLVGATASTDSSGGALVDINIVTDRTIELRTFLSATGAANDWGSRLNLQVAA